MNISTAITTAIPCTQPSVYYWERYHPRHGKIERVAYALPMQWNKSMNQSYDRKYFKKNGEQRSVVRVGSREFYLKLS